MIRIGQQVADVSPKLLDAALESIKAHLDAAGDMRSQAVADKLIAA